MPAVLLFIVTVSAALPVGAQQRLPVFRASTEQVVVPVTVKDAQGRLIGGLDLQDFRLLEDGVEQQLTGVSSDPAPLAVAIVIDAAMSRPPTERLRATFPSLPEAFSEFDEAAIFAFDAGFRQVTDFTSQKDRLYTALKRLEMGADSTRAGEPLTSAVPRINRWPVGGPPPQPSSPTGKNIDDAVAAAARRLLDRAPWRRKLILLITDGLNSSRNQVSSQELLARLRQGGAAVYSIGLDDARLAKGSTVLARYGPATGGEFYTAVKKASIEPLYARITEQARYQYILTYVPARPATIAPVFRSIEVRVKRPQVNVIARDGYIPEPRAPQP